MRRDLCERRSMESETVCARRQVQRQSTMTNICGWVWGDCVGEACVLWFSYVAAAISVWPKITVMGPKNENAMAGHV
jgi:hypothetical protein